MMSESSESHIGVSVIINKYTEIMFVQILRAFAINNIGKESYFSALVDNQLSQVLALMHKMPEHNWSVGEFSSEVAMSRSSFHKRFTDSIAYPQLNIYTNGAWCSRSKK